MKQETISIGGITFIKKNVLKMKKSHFMNAYNDEELWNKIQDLKPKKKTKPKKNDSE